MQGEHVTKTVNTQSAVMSQKIDAAFSSAENRQEGDREGRAEKWAQRGVRNSHDVKGSKIKSIEIIWFVVYLNNFYLLYIS